MASARCCPVSPTSSNSTRPRWTPGAFPCSGSAASWRERKQLLQDMSITAVGDAFRRRGERHRARARGQRPRPRPFTRWARRAWDATRRLRCSMRTIRRTTCQQSFCHRWRLHGVIFLRQPFTYLHGPHGAGLRLCCQSDEARRNLIWTDESSLGTMTAATILSRQLSWAAGDHKIDKVGLQLYTIRSVNEGRFRGQAGESRGRSAIAKSSLPATTIILRRKCGPCSTATG